MKLHFAMFAGYAELAPDGRVSLLSGDIDTLLVPLAFPVTAVLPIHLVAKLIVEPADMGREHTSTVEIVAPDGSIIERAERTRVINEKPGALPTKLGLTLTFYNVVYPAPGIYTARILNNGDEMGTIKFEVKPVPSPTPPDKDASQ